jgi:hypothetical protein
MWNGDVILFVIREDDECRHTVRCHLAWRDRTPGHKSKRKIVEEKWVSRRRPSMELYQNVSWVYLLCWLRPKLVRKSRNKLLLHPGLVWQLNIHLLLMCESLLSPELFFCKYPALTERIFNMLNTFDLLLSTSVCTLPVMDVNYTVHNITNIEPVDIWTGNYFFCQCILGRNMLIPLWLRGAPLLLYCDMLYYVLSAQLFLQPQTLRHRGITLCQLMLILNCCFFHST